MSIVSNLTSDLVPPSTHERSSPHQSLPTLAATPMTRGEPMRTDSEVHAPPDINCATKNSHVKTNLVHTLHRMQKVGTLHVGEYSFTKQAATNALQAVKENKPWYNIPRAKFLEYIHNVSV